MTIWVTRAEPGAGATARRLEMLGRRALNAPVLHVSQLDVPEPPSGYGALAFTSANGVRAFAARSERRELPAYVVGEATAAAARTAGFTTVVSANGDVADLSRVILANPPEGSVLHVCGSERAGDLQGALATAGVAAATLPLYRTEGIAALPESVSGLLDAGALDIVLIHSPKAGDVVARLLQGRPGTEQIRAVGLSEACLRPLQPLGLRALLPAARPDEAALLERLG